MDVKIIEKTNNSECPDGYKELACKSCGAIYYVPDNIESFLCPTCCEAAGETIDSIQQKTALNK